MRIQTLYHIGAMSSPKISIGTYAFKLPIGGTKTPYDRIFNPKHTELSPLIK